MAVSTTPRGGAWLIDRTASDGIMTPERLTEEQRLIGRTAEAFVANEVIPSLDRLERKDWELARRLVQQCGDLGFLGTDVPEQYGGVGLDKTSSLVVAERVSVAASFGAAFGAQTGLSVMPILCFGTTAQKEKYLPGLVSGEVIGAYALSEAGSGSDALGAKARATRRPDGSYALTGEKMWITNGGFADLFIVFAKIDGDKFTAFIVERAFPGVATGPEEHKMGLLGSSTTSVILQEALVPEENLLGEIGKGHKVAFNVLNYGRFKLGAMCTGVARTAIGEAARYAVDRQQFGQPIASFGAIKHKIGEMTVRTYAVESMLYRLAGSVDTLLRVLDPADGTAVLRALEEFAVESSIAKVAGSEMLDFVLDENIQVHGGNGFVKDYPAERHYRDARVNRIFEGTNEINRLLIPGMLVKRALKGDLAVIPAAKKLQDEIFEPPSFDTTPSDASPLDAELAALGGFKKVGLMLLGLAMQKHGEALSEQQEVLAHAADVIIDTFAAESAVLRARQAVDDRHPVAPAAIDAAEVFTSDAASRIEMTARQALAAMADGDTLRVHLAMLRRFLRNTPIDTVVRRRRLAEATATKGEYVFA